MRHFRNALENCALSSGSCKGKIVSNGWVYSCRLWLLITSPHNLWLWRKQVIHFDSCHSSICHFALSCHLHEQLKKLLLAVPLLSSSCWLSLKDKWHWGMTCCSVWQSCYLSSAILLATTQTEYTIKSILYLSSYFFYWNWIVEVILV